MHKLIFANQLRGLAALFVVVTHYIGIYCGAPQVVSAITFSPNLPFVTPAWVAHLNFRYFSTGPFGVALFFLISGLVISFTLEHNRPWAFLVARCFRIFPTYLFALVLGLLVVWLSSRYWGIAFGYGFKEIASNALLINNLFALASIDAVNWTLAVEIKFYLLLAFAKPWFLLAPYRTVAGFALLVLAATAVDAAILPATGPAGLPGIAVAIKALLIEANYIVFMSIGVLFYRHVKGAFSWVRLVPGALALLLIFTLTWAIGPQREQFYIVTLDYYFAFGVFLLCCMGRQFFRPIRLLDFFADISFPLYVVHSLLGYTLLKLAMSHGISYPVALFGVFSVVVAVAYGVHLQIELTSNRLGKRLAARLQQGRAGQSGGTLGAKGAKSSAEHR